MIFVFAGDRLVQGGIVWYRAMVGRTPAWRHENKLGLAEQAQ
jgi:hypothetical protein